MNNSKRKFLARFAIAVLAALPVAVRAPAQTTPAASAEPARLVAALRWETPAQWRRGMLRKTMGVLAIDDSGVTFRPSRGAPLHWSFQEIQTFDLTARFLRLTGYQNRRWHMHGEREFRFALTSAMPPSVAAALARRVGKPSENGIANPNAAVVASIAARHRTFGGGTNGILRFRETGLDYVTPSGKGERSWRWADIETLSLPDPYHLSLGAYRETFAFELKQPMSRGLFDWLWNKVYGRNLAGLDPEMGAVR